MSSIAPSAASGPLAAFIADTHDLISADVEKIEDARVFLLGETHLTEAHDVKNSFIINKLYRPGDVLLIEGGACNDHWDSRTRFFRQQMTIKSWDDNPSLEWCGDEIKKINDVLTASINVRDHCGDALWPESIRVLSAFLPESMQVLDFNWTRVSEQERCGVGDRLIHMCTLYFSGKMGVYLMGDADSQTKRNQSMVDAINENLTLRNRVFVVAGSAHLAYESDNESEASTDPLVTASFRKAMGELTRETTAVRVKNVDLLYRELKQYAVLLPNKSKDSVGSLRRELIGWKDEITIKVGMSFVLAALYTLLAPRFLYRRAYRYFTPIQERKIQLLTDDDFTGAFWGHKLAATIYNTVEGDPVHSQHAEAASLAFDPE